MCGPPEAGTRSDERSLVLNHYLEKIRYLLISTMNTFTVFNFGMIRYAD